MTGRPRSTRGQIYQILRTTCGFTHDQAKILIRTYLNDMGSWNHVLSSGKRKEKEIWAKPAEIVAAMSLRRDPVEAGRSIVNQCWPDRDQDPEATFVCASMAAGIVNDAMGFTDKERRLMWYQIEKILRHEEDQAILAWRERLIRQYLQIRGFLPD